MKRLSLSTLCTALVLTLPAQANSYSVVVVEPTLREQATHTLTAPTEAQVVEFTAQKACERPFIRDLKGRVIYDECLAAARSKARSQLLAARKGAEKQLAVR